MNKKVTVHEMALEGDVAGIEAAVEAKPDVVKSKDDSGRVPLHWAVSRGHVDMSGWLLGLTKDVDIEDDAGWTPLIIASSAGHTEIVQMLIEKGADVNQVTSEGRSSLLYAASKGRANIVTMLTQKGADVNKADKLGATPLHRASGPGHSDIVKMLLSLDETIVDCQDRYGNTALHTACEEERVEVCQLLISHGANREIQNRDEKTPLQLCSPQFARSLKA